MPDLTPWIGAISALAGTALGVVGTLYTESIRHRRELALTTRTERKEVLVRYLVACSDAVRAIEQGARHRANSPRGQRRDPQSADFAALGDDCATIYEEIEILAPRGVSEVASQMLLAVWELKEMVRQGAGKNSPEYEAALKSYTDTRDDFLAATRSNLTLDN